MTYIHTGITVTPAARRCCARSSQRPVLWGAASHRFRPTGTFTRQSSGTYTCTHVHKSCMYVCIVMCKYIKHISTLTRQSFGMYTYTSGHIQDTYMTLSPYAHLYMNHTTYMSVHIHSCARGLFRHICVHVCDVFMYTVGIQNAHRLLLNACAHIHTYNHTQRAYACTDIHTNTCIQTCRHIYAHIDTYTCTHTPPSCSHWSTSYQVRTRHAGGHKPLRRTQSLGQPVCMYVGMHVCMDSEHICLFAVIRPGPTSLSLSVCVCMYVCIYVCMHVYIYVCMHVYMYICIYNVCMYIYIYMYVCMYICIYVYTHNTSTHIHNTSTHIHIHIHIHMYACKNIHVCILLYMCIPLCA
jgi:hypothetical protein